MSSTSNILIPERLISARERLHLSKAEAARMTGLTATSYVRYEAGDRCPSPQVVMTIAEKLGTSVAFLSGETDDISPDVISIHKKDNPLMFKLISDAQNADDTTLQRLLNYYRQLKSNN